MAVRKRVPGSPDQAQQPIGSLNNTKTDITRWRLRSDGGRHTWHYLQSDDELKQWPMTTADKYFLGLDTVGIYVQDLAPTSDLC